ncbi:MAG TPA: TetR/AcrR family transcriptional regulator [Solirubrobacteraceae bacterium]|nr:TetR/AcrR family transcriptional regulator [Solirubrobacteraceae bacterium]
MPSRQRNSARDDILRVFAEMVARNGYAETSIGDVAAVLGLSKGTVVYHFNSKLELLEEVHLDYIRRGLAQAHYVLASLPTASSQLAGIVYALLKAHRDDRPATIAFLREIVRFTDGAPKKAVAAPRDAYTSLVRGILSRGMQSGEFRMDDPELVTFQVFAMCNYTWTWYRPDGRRSIEEIARSYIRTLLIGLATASSIDQDGVDAVIDSAMAAVHSAPTDFS